LKPVFLKRVFTRSAITFLSSFDTYAIIFS
jgi:hypothetical protein